MAAKYLLTFDTHVTLDDERCEQITDDLMALGLSMVEVDPYRDHGHATFEADEPDEHEIATVLAAKHDAEAISIMAIAHDHPEEA